MLTSATGKRICKRRSLAWMRGFTLIELLVVLLIIAFVAVVVVVNAPPLQSNGKKAAEDFALSLKLADDVAVLSNQPVRLVMEERRYYYELYAGAEWQPALLGKFPQNYRIPQNVIVTLATANLVKDNEKRLLSRDENEDNEEDDDQERQYAVIDPTGLPVIIRADFHQRSRRWSVSRNDKGEVSIVVNRN